MATRSNRRPPPEIINIASDSDDSDDEAVVTPQRRQSAPLDFDNNGNLSPIDEQQFFDAFQNAVVDPTLVASPEPANMNGTFIVIDGEEVFIPDEIPPQRAAATSTRLPATQQGREMANDPDNGEVTADTCLRRVLEIFPDISLEHVLKLYNDFDANEGYELMSGSARLDNIIEQLVSASSYPKQEKGKQAVKKRKREDSIDEADTEKWEAHDREFIPHFLKGSMQSMLKSEYPDIPVQYINDTLAKEKHFYQAYVALAKAKDNPDPNKRTYGKGRPSTKALANADVIATNCGWPDLVEELGAARKRVERVRAETAVEDAKKRAEEENLRRAMEHGETAECSACFDDLPMNRQIHCDGLTAHFTCYDCATTYIQSEVGESRCRVLCTAGCGAPFAPNQLNKLEDKQLLEKLAELEQEKAIRDAGLDNLEECPFCDYKAILPPIEEDFEFRCANPECEKVSCRRCKSISHIPVSCEQHAKDNKVNSRHKIEEAMTAAMIRSCNKCKKQFIKEYGCNKMTCPSCGNLQCYVCSEPLKNYDHFDQAPGRALGAATAGKKCPLYDNVEERHEREVKEAEAAAKAQLLAENPDVSAEDLEFKLSDRVKKEAADRIQKAGGPGGGIGGLAGMPMGFEFGGMGAHNHARDILRAMRLGADPENDDDDDADGGEINGAPRMPAGAREAIRAARARRADRQAAVTPRAAAAEPVNLANDPMLAANPQHQPAMQGYIPVFGFDGAHNPQPNPQFVPPQAPPPPQRAPHYHAAHFHPFADFADDMDLFFNPAPNMQHPFGFADANAVRQLHQMRQQQHATNAAPAQPQFHGLPGAFPGNAPPAHGGGVDNAHLLALQRQQQALQRQNLMRQQRDAIRNARNQRPY